MPIDPSLRRTSQTNSNAYAQSTQTTHYRPSARKQPEQTYHYTINTTSGKRYTLDQNRANWIINRWKRDGADSYGYDDDDQMAKRNGQMSAAMRGTYKNSQVDRDLFSMGLPSEKYLERYMEDYDRWHTGDISKVFGNNVPDDDWTGMKRMYQQSFRYENTPEDQARKRQGLVPLSQLDKYTDTELDDDLLSKGLPPMAELGKYAGMYNNYKGVDNLYKNAALAYTRVRATQDVNGKFIQNDNNSYTVMDPTTGQTTTKTGKQWYAKSFYDELGRTNEDGSFVYGDIIPLLKKSRSESEDDDYVDPTKSFIEQMDEQFAAYGKEDDNEDDFLNHQAFSYDDFAKNYESYYTKYIKDLQANGQGQTIEQLLGIVARDADERAVNDYYTVDYDHDDIERFITRYEEDYPDNSYEDMFRDMFKHNVDEHTVEYAANILQNRATKNRADDKASGFYDIGDSYVKAKQEQDTSWRNATKRDATYRRPDVSEADDSIEKLHPDAETRKEFLKKVNDAISVYDSAVAAYEDTAGPGAPSEASREPINKANELLKSLGFKSIHSARRYVDSATAPKAQGHVLDEDEQALAGLKSYMDEAGEWTMESARSAMNRLRDDGYSEDVIQAVAEEMQRVYGNLPEAPSPEKPALVTDDEVAGYIRDYANRHGDAATGKWTEDKAFELLGELRESGVSQDVVMRIAEKEGDLFKYADQFYGTERARQWSAARREDQLSDEMRAAIDAAKKAEADDKATIDATRKAIMDRLYDEDGNDLVVTDVDSVMRVIDDVMGLDWTNPVAMQLALQDLGFGDEFSGLADDLTHGWSESDRNRLAYHLGLDKLRNISTDFMLGDSWAATDQLPDMRKLETADFQHALKWAQTQIASGRLSAYEAYNILAANGLQNEMEEYMGDEWHKAHYKAVVVPQEAGKATGLNQLTWEEMTPEQRDAMGEELWAQLPAAEMAQRYGRKDWWKYDPSVYRTGGQALEQQLLAVLPGFATNIMSGGVKLLDAIDAGITGRPEMWDATQKLMDVEEGLSRYGSVYDNVNGAKYAAMAGDALQEILRMETLGSIGGIVGGAFAGTAVGSALTKAASASSSSKVVKKAADMFLGMVGSSPFVASAFASNYAEAKQAGAPNNEAAWYGMITGMAEGVLEGFEFDNLWGKALGQNRFGKQLLDGKNTFLRELGIVGKARLASIAASGLGEFTEESIGYVLETFLKMRHSDTWGKGTEWSKEDWIEQAMMGFITGALGGGIHTLGSINKQTLIRDYAMSDKAVMRQVFPDVYTATEIAESLPESVLDTYREGGPKVMSLSAYRQFGLTLESCLDNAKKQVTTFNDEKAKVDTKLANRLRELDGYASKAVSIDASKGSGAKELANLVSSKLGIELDASKPLMPQVKAAFKVEVERATNDHDKAVADLRTTTENALRNSESELKNLQKQLQEHYVGIYLMSEQGIMLKNPDWVLSNMAQAYMNGATVTKESLAQQTEAANATQTKLAEAEATETIEEAKETAEAPENTAVKARELAYDRVYKDHEAGKAYAEEGGKNDSKLTPVEFAENERQNFQAKTTARLRRVTLELAGLEAKEGMSAKEIFDEANKVMTPEAAQKLDMYQKLSKALGLNMVVRDVVAGTSGYVHDGKLYVTLNGKQSMLRVAAHELTHYMKGHASEQYDALRTSLVNEVGQEKFDELLAEKAQEYGLDLNDAKARLEADDEVCAELCEKMLENKDALERFVQSDLDAAKTLKQRLAKTLVAIKSAIRSIGTSDAQTKADLIKQQDTIEQWYKGLSDAIDNANKANGKTSTATETATVTETTTEAQPQAPPVETNPDLFMGEESARREQLRSDLEELAKKGTKVQDVSRQEVNDVLDRVILGDKSNYNKADYAQIRGMLAQLIPEVQAMVNGDESVDVDALNERVSAALDYMLERYSEGSEDYYGLRDLIPNKIALTEAAYNELRSRDMTLREASNELRNALGGKFVNFVYKKSPGYNNAMSIDELWTRIADAYGEPDGYGNIQEDALALIDYAKDRNTRTSFDDLYGSQREDVVNAQVGEFLDAVQSMAEGKAAETAALHKIDDDYMGLVKQYEDGDRKAERQLENDISEAAKISGYTTPMLFHGTPKFGWTTYQDSRHDTPFIYTSTKPEVAAHYAGDQNYAFRRDIGKKYDGGDSLESIIEDARWVYETRFQKPTEQSKIARYASDIDTASKIADRIDYLWGKVDYDTRTFPEEMDNIIHGMADIFYTIRDGDVAYGKTADEAARFLASDVEAQKELSENIAWSLRYLDRSREAFRNYYGEHRDEMSRDEKALFSYLMSYEVGDAAIDIEYGLALLLNNDRVLQRVADGGFVSADELRKGMDASHNIGAYKLYGDLGDNPFVFDANGGQFWALKVPEVSDGYTDTDAVSRWALANGYTSVVMKNIYDYGDKADNYVFFSPSQIKSADPVTYDDDGNVIPPSERFTRSENDIRWTVDDDYLPLAERYDAGIATEEDTEELRKDVDEAARENGYSTTQYYHGTPFQFNSFDRGQSKASNDFGSGIYLTNNEVNAMGYSGKGGVVNMDLLESVGSYAESVANGKYDYKTQHYDWIHEYNRAFEERLDELQEQGRVIPLYAKLTNPFTVSDSDYIPVEEAERIIMRSDASDADKVSFLKTVSALQTEHGTVRTSDFANGDFSPYLSNALEKLGYDGIIDKTAAIKHGQLYGTEHLVVFDARNVKESSLVTYDEDNNIIPLSERFDQNKTDIRWTVDNDLNDLVNQYGAIEQGREPRARDVQVPRQSADNTRVSKFTRSIEESSKVTDAQAAEIASEIGSEADRVKQLWSYIPKSNDETMKKAKEFIAARQPATAQREFHDMVVGGKYGTKTAAIGLQLLADASARDDWASVKEIAYDLRVLATEAGQSAQIFNVLKDLGGVGSAWYVEKLVNNLNTMYADEIQSGQMDPITVSEAAMNQVRAAKTQVEVDAAERLVADEIGPQLPLKLDEKLSNWRYLSMLGNPVTHIRNVTGNNLMHLMGGMKDVVASGVQRILEKTGVTDESDRAHARLTSADKSYWDDFAQKSYDEQKRNLQGGGKLGFQSLVQQSKRSFDNKVLDAIARGKDPGTMSERKGLVGLLQNIRNNGAMGMLEVEDAWGLEKNYKRSLMEYMKAQGYSLNNEGKVGKVGKDGSFTEITNEQMNKAIEWATNQAWTNTFRGPSALATELNKISKMNTASKLIVEGVMPFKKTPINIAKQGAMYSPAGIVIGTTELLTKVKHGKMSAATAIDHLSSGLTGTALMALGVVLAKAGILRGGGEDKKKLETYLEDTGDQTYAFKFGNVSINMSAIAPATIPLFMGVALQEMLSRNGEDEGVDLSTITDVLAGTLNPFMEMSFMSSLNSALKNYNNEGIGGALGSTILTAAQNYGSQYLPTLGGKVAQFIDPTQRTTKSSATSPVGGNMDYYWRSLVKKVPGAEATLQPDVNIWGQTTTKDSFGDWALDFANKFILPTNIKVTNRDAVDNELIRVVESTGNADFLPSDGAKYFKVKGETYKMNASQYTAYSQERGQAAYAAIKELMQSPSYINATDETKAEMLKKALDAAYKTVNNIWKDRLGAFNH